MQALLDRYIAGAIAFANDADDDDDIAHFEIAEQIGELQERDDATIAIKLAVAEHVRTGCIDLEREASCLADELQLSALRAAMANAPAIAAKIAALGFPQ